MALAGQLKDARDRWAATCAINTNLQRELVGLRQQASHWQVGTLLCYEKLTRSNVIVTHSL